VGGWAAAILSRYPCVPCIIRVCLLDKFMEYIIVCGFVFVCGKRGKGGAVYRFQ